MLAALLSWPCNARVAPEPTIPVSERIILQVIGAVILVEIVVRRDKAAVFHSAVQVNPEPAVAEDRVTGDVVAGAGIGKRAGHGDGQAVARIMSDGVGCAARTADCCLAGVGYERDSSIVPERPTGSARANMISSDAIAF